MTTFTEQQEVKDFSSNVNVRFKINHVGGPSKGVPEFFEGVPELPALDMIEFANMLESLDENSYSRETFTKIVNLILTDESAQRFVARLGDKIDPIGMKQLMDILPWLMEQYGMRPTSLPDPSADGSGSQDNGTSSPQTANLPELISPESPQPAS